MEDFYYRKLKVYHQAKALVATSIIYAKTSLLKNLTVFQIRFNEPQYLYLQTSRKAWGVSGYITNEQLAAEEKNITEIAKMLIGLRKTLEDKMTNKYV